MAANPRTRLWMVIGVLVAVIAAGGTAWAVLGRESAAEAAGIYLSAWTEGDFGAMRAVAVEPPADLAARHRQSLSDLGATAAGYELGEVQEADGRARAAFTASVTVPGFGVWRYPGELPLERSGKTWRVRWTPSVIHPKLGVGDRFRVKRKVKPEPAPVLAAGGTRIDTPGTPGSIQQVVDELRGAYRKRLSGAPATRIQVVFDDGGARTVAERSPAPGRPVKTTLDLRVHEAAAGALEDVAEPASLVAIRPSTAEILAIVNKPGGYNRALMGTYAPGSTFKVVTASAAVAGGLKASSRVSCPARRVIGGFEFHNAGYKEFGTLRLREAFAHSCNTTFAEFGVARIGGRRLTQVAESFGFNAPVPIGVPAVRAEFPAPRGATDLAAASFGQGRVQASPLNMAAVTSAIKAGAWRAPRLVTADLLTDVPAPRRIEKPVLRALRKLMPAVVAEGGTAGTVQFPQGVAGKTGTAEYDAGGQMSEHSWFIGYRGDLAFAVIVEGAGEGAAVAAPTAARFLRGLPR